MHVLEVYGTTKWQKKQQKGPGNRSDKEDMVKNYGSTTIRLCGLGPLFESQYSHLLSSIQYFLTVFCLCACVSEKVC